MTQDPKHAGPQPEQQQAPPGHTAEMAPKPDHGEECTKAVASSRAAPRSSPAAIRYWPRGGHCLRPEGADVLISYLPEEEDDARETARWVEQAGRRVVLVPGDISDQQHCKDIVERAVSESASSTFVALAGHAVGVAEIAERIVGAAFREIDVFLQCAMASSYMPFCT